MTQVDSGRGAKKLYLTYISKVERVAYERKKNE